ncbi:hypothetical protein K0M31_012833 [Melipona bicolor]|uniref:Uncharacterized protein n=1 Tax=Melipona bicolor TaxID=60889 RepID=A0AA40FJR5_9HYME|nr:hypothetical protein K0M31_012833 [Melipona bicolor]
MGPLSRPLRVTSLVTRNASLSDLYRYLYLKQAVKGEAARAIKYFPVADSFEAAWEVLRERYEDDDYAYNKLNNRHHRHQQRDDVHRTDEVPPAKRNFLSPTLEGDAGLNGGKLDLLTDLPPNLSDGELLINDDDAHKTSRDVEEREEEVEIKDETAKAGVEETRGIQDKYITSDIEILGGSDSIEIPQTQ